jgi:hypothetical protein
MIFDERLHLIGRCVLYRYSTGAKVRNRQEYVRVAMRYPCQDHLLITRLLADICLDQKGDTVFKALGIELKGCQTEQLDPLRGRSMRWVVRGSVSDGR